MKKNFKFYLLLLLFSIISGLYIYNHRLDLNPDGVSYLDIAQTYSSGNIRGAINAYWSPGFSWVLMLLNFSEDWLFTSKIVIFLSSLLWFISGYLLFRTVFHKPGKTTLGLFLITIFPGSYEIWRLITPDLMFAGFVNIWLIWLFKLTVANQSVIPTKVGILKIPAFARKTNERYIHLLLLGILTGIGFLIKSYFLFFSVIFFSILLLFRFILKKELLIFLIGAIIIPLSWALMIFGKYGNFSFGTTFNITYKHHVQNQEFLFLTRPLSPPAFGTSFWTDPSDFSAVKFNPSNQLIAVKNSLNNTLIFIFKNYHLGLILIAGYLWQRKFKENEKLILIFIIFWVAIYSLIYIEPRYLWPVIVPIFILLINSLKNNLISRFLFSIFLIISIILFSRLYLKNLPPDPNSIFHIQISSEINPPCVMLSDVWDRGLYISYLSGCKYYGITKTAFYDKDIQTELLKEFQTGQVKYFLTFNYENYKNVIPISYLQNSWFFSGKHIGLYNIKSF